MKKQKNENRRPKIQVQVSEELNEKVGRTAEEIGMSKSAFCAFIIGDYFTQREQMQEGVKSVVQKMIEQQGDRLM